MAKRTSREKLKIYLLGLAVIASLSFYFFYTWVVKSSAVSYISGRDYWLNPVAVYRVADNSPEHRKDFSIIEKLLYYRVVLPPNVLVFSMLPVYLVSLSLILLPLLYLRNPSENKPPAASFEVSVPASGGGGSSAFRTFAKEPVQVLEKGENLVPVESSPTSIHPLFRAVVNFCQLVRAKEVFLYIFFPIRNSPFREKVRRGVHRWKVSPWGYIFRFRCCRFPFSSKIKKVKVVARPLRKKDFEYEPLVILQKVFVKNSKLLHRKKYSFLVVATPSSGPLSAFLWKSGRFAHSSKKAGALRMFVKKFKKFVIKMKHSQMFSPYQDGLTGLMRRDYAETKVETWKSVGVVIFDIDDFKKINDTYGHSVGDSVLRFVGRLLKGLFSQIDGAVPFRYGGEEFAVFFRPEHFREAVSIAEKFRKAVEKGSSSFGFKVTVSGGVAAGSSFTEAYRRADSLLYLSKRSGKNRINWRSY